MATASSISFSASFPSFPSKSGKIAMMRSSKTCLCKKSSSSSSSSSLPRITSALDKSPAQSPPKNRHWKAGEFPGISESSIARSARPPIKNIKKKIDDRAAARAWACTVTEALSDRIQKKQWQQALEHLSPSDLEPQIWLGLPTEIVEVEVAWEGIYSLVVPMMRVMFRLARDWMIMGYAW